MKKFLTNILKGGMVGIAAVIPGFSGGTIACILGCYDELIEAISGIRIHFKKSVLTLLPYILGIIVFALIFIFPITQGIKHYPLITISLFAGLLIGGLPSFYKNIQGKASKFNILCALLGGAVILAIVIPSLFAGDAYISLTEAPWWMYFVVLLMGVIGSVALVVPGISGSMVLLILGFYNPIMDTIKAFIASVFSATGHEISMEFASDSVLAFIGKDYILPSLGLILCFGIGIVFGFFLISKLMKYLLSRYPDATYFAIFGFILASLVGIYAESAYYQNIDAVQIILAVALLGIGFCISYFLAKFAEKKTEELKTKE